MFTGIVTAVGRIATVHRDGERLELTVESPYEDLGPGESIAVAGACLTVVSAGAGSFRVQAVATTRGRTRFADLRVGERVNLERAIRAGEPFGGHFVQGHVDGVGRVRAVHPEDDALLLDVTVPADVAAVTVPHGAITVEGVSLTVNRIPNLRTVQVSLIPYTREHTTLGGLAEGDRVHVEGDLLGKYLRQLLRRGPRSGATGAGKKKGQKRRTR